MEITLEGLEAGKPTIIKDNEYLATKEYTEPFIEKMKKFTTDFVVNVQMPDQVTVSDDNKDITFNRVWVQAIMPTKTEYAETYNLVYALDTRIPFYKVFKAYINTKTKNMYAFSDSWEIVNELKPKTVLEYDLDSLFKVTDDFNVKADKLNKTFFKEDKLTTFGELIDKVLVYEYKNKAGKVKLSANDIIKAYESVYKDSGSEYFVKDQTSSVFNYFDAVCAQVTAAKDFTNRFEKTLIVSSLFNAEKIC